MARHSYQGSMTLSVMLLALGAFPTLGIGQPPVPERPPEKTMIEEGRKSKLGVYSRTQLNGSLIMKVIEGSPAWKAGLEDGDIILKVDGYTLGYIDGLEYPLQSEIRRSTGKVRLDVRNKRNPNGPPVVKDIDLGK